MESLADLIGPSPEMETLRGQVRRLLQLPAGHRAPRQCASAVRPFRADRAEARGR